MGKHLEKREKVLCAMAAVCLVLGAACGGFIPGMRFSGYLLTGLAGLFLLAAWLERWARQNRKGKLCKRIFLYGMTALLVLFSAVQALLYSKGHQQNEGLPSDVVLVLGAGVNGEAPSLVLQSRIDAAAEYLRRWPEVPAILSGGMGPGERISEAECMRRGLVARGIDAARLTLEDQSATTAENMAFSKAKLAELGLDPDTAVVAVVTSDFHCFRASGLAADNGITACSLPARTFWLFLPTYWIREWYGILYQTL